MTTFDARLVRDTLDVPAIEDVTAAARAALAPVLAGAGCERARASPSPPAAAGSRASTRSCAARARRCAKRAASRS